MGNKKCKFCQFGKRMGYRQVLCNKRNEWQSELYSCDWFKLRQGKFRFRVITTDIYNDVNKIVKKYPWLYEYGYNEGYISFDTLDELMTMAKIVEKDGSSLIIFASHWVAKGEPAIEIYDNYRE